jgi:hypothetical protein
MHLRPTEPLPLNHSWPLFEAPARCALGLLHDADDAELCDLPFGSIQGLGRWECDLTDNSLTWSDEVYDLFGFPRGARLSRPDTVAVYSEDSRAVMERLRAYAIRYHRGFTVDVQIRPHGFAPRWMRLVAAPVCIDGLTTRLRGIKIPLLEAA